MPALPPDPLSRADQRVGSYLRNWEGVEMTRMGPFQPSGRVTATPRLFATPLDPNLCLMIPSHPRARRLRVKARRDRSQDAGNSRAGRAAAWHLKNAGLMSEGRGERGADAVFSQRVGDKPAGKSIWSETGGSPDGDDPR